MAFALDMRRVRAIVWKDLTSERRSKAGFNAVAFLGVLILLLFGFALGPDTEALRDAAAGAHEVIGREGGRPEIGAAVELHADLRGDRSHAVVAAAGRDETDHAGQSEGSHGRGVTHQ